ncbi:hypothetical protein EMIT0324P_30735 [Pseudomonas chlororaphis]
MHRLGEDYVLVRSLAGSAAATGLQAGHPPCVALVAPKAHRALSQPAAAATMPPLFLSPPLEPP